MTAVATATDEAAVWCQGCGLEVPVATARLRQAEIIIQGLERSVRGKIVQIRELEGDHSKDLRKHKRYDEAVEVLEYWKKHLAPKAREITSENRVRIVIKRLEADHTVEGLKLCIDGYARFPYVVDPGRRSPRGRTSERRIDPTLIFRDPDHVEAGIAMAKKQDADEQAIPMYLDWRKVRRENYRVLFDELTKLYGKPIKDEGVLTPTYISVCPRCDAEGFVLHPPEEMLDLCKCWSCGADEGVLLAALKEDS